MYAAKIEIGWINGWFKGDTPSDIIKAVEKHQDFGCLLQMGQMNEGKKGQKELDKLESFLEKYHSGKLGMDDIMGLEIRLSVGNIVCHEITTICKDDAYDIWNDIKEEIRY